MRVATVPLRNRVGALLFLIVLVPLGFLAAREYLEFDVGFQIQADPLGYVEVVDPGRPNAAVPSALFESLRTASGQTWRTRLLQDRDEQLGREPYDGNRKAQTDLSRSVELPDPADYSVIGVAANTMNPAVVARDGALYVIWFSTPADAENWLTADPQVFTDAAVEGRRTSYWAGSFAVYYAPPADGHDWSGEVLTAVREFAGA